MNLFLPQLLLDLGKMRQALPAVHVRKAIQVILSIWAMAFFDVFSLASLLPIVGLLLDTSIIHSNALLNTLYAFTGFARESHFILAGIFLALGLFILKNWVGVTVIHFQSRFIYDVASYLSEKGLRDYYEKDFLAVNDLNSSVPIRDVLLRPVEFSVYVLLAALTLLSELTVLILIVVGIAIYSLQVLGIMILVLGPPLTIVFLMKSRRMTRVGRLSDKLKAISQKYLQENIQSYVDVKLYHKEAFFTRRFVETQRELNRNFSLIHTLGLMPPKVIEVAAGFGMAALLFYGLLSFQAEKDIVLLLSLFVASAYRIIPSMNRMLNAVFNMRSYHHTIGVLERPPAAGRGIEPGTSPMPEPFYFKEHFSLENLSYRYPDSQSFELRNISFTVRRGEIVGFIGKSGSGKSTLMHLLLRFLKEQSGRIVVDGKPLLPGETRAWQDLLGYVKQDPFLMEGTILENIAFGDDGPRIDTDRIDQVVNQAGLQALIAQLPLGIDALIAAGGTQLLQAQKQRLAIARALYRNAEILIFDEAGNEQDSETERDALQALSDLGRGGKTILIMAQRIATLQICHRIYELDQGEIINVCRYDELADRKTGYVEA